MHYILNDDHRLPISFFTAVVMAFVSPITPTNLTADPSTSTTLTPLSSAMSLSEATGMTGSNYDALNGGKSIKPIVHHTTGITDTNRSRTH